MERADFEKQVLDNLDIVKIIATKIHARIPYGIELADLVHSGILGLIDAVGKYDVSKGVKFATYASLRIRGAILDELRNLDWASRTLRQKIKDVENAFETLEIELGRPPSEDEVAESLHMSLPEFQKILDESKGVGIGVFRISGEDEANITDGKMIKYYADDESVSPVMMLEKEEMKKMLTAMMKNLPAKEQLVLSLYYIEDLNLKEIGKIMELTESRISQIRSAAVLRLRARLAEMAGRDNVRVREIV